MVCLFLPEKMEKDKDCYMLDWNAADLEKAIESGKKVFVKFWKNGCGACKLAIPATQRLEDKFKDRVLFGQICMDDNEELYELLETQVLPSFFTFADAELRGKSVGFKGLAKLECLIEETLVASSV